MKSLDDFLPRVLPYVPMCPEPMVRQALVEAAIEFCSRTEVVQTLSDFVLRAGRSVYDIELPMQQSLVNVIEVVFERREVDAVSYPVPELPPGRPQSVVKPLPSTSELTLVPAPDAATAGKRVTVRAAFKPTPKATQLADELFNDWHDAVVQGALKRLCAMPSQPFTAAGTVVVATQAFADYVVEARLVARKKRLVHASRVRPNPLA